MPIRYTIAIDTAEDGTYAADLSADVLRAQWRLGLDRPTDVLAAPSRATLTLRNRAGAYAPERSYLGIGQRLRITSDDGTTTRTHFVGRIERLDPQAGDQGGQEATLIAAGLGATLARHTVRLAPRANQRADQLIDALLDQVGYRRDLPAGYCVLDWAGRNQIDHTRPFAPESLPRTLQAGQSTFPYVGDTWGAGVSAAVAIEQVVAGEGGYFVLNRADEAVFLNRHAVLMNETLAATFADDMAALEYRYGAEIINAVDVLVVPRRIGAANSRLWGLEAPQPIERGESLLLNAPFRDANQNPVGALSLVTPLPDVHFRATVFADPASSDRTAAVQVVVRDVSASAALLEIRNRARTRLHVQQLDLYGTPLITGDALIISERDDLSITRYGIRPQRLDGGLIADTEEAQALARARLLQAAQPRGLAQWLTTSTRRHAQATLALTLFDRVQVRESQTGHAQDYVILAEEHRVAQGGAQHEVTWLLASVDDERFFVVDRHSVDGTPILLPR